MSKIRKSFQNDCMGPTGGTGAPSKARELGFTSNSMVVGPSLQAWEHGRVDERLQVVQNLFASFGVHTAHSWMKEHQNGDLRQAFLVFSLAELKPRLATGALNPSLAFNLGAETWWELSLGRGDSFFWGWGWGGQTPSQMK